jgi:hypothetical protein
VGQGFPGVRRVVTIKNNRGRPPKLKSCKVCQKRAAVSIVAIISTANVTPQTQKCTKSASFCRHCFDALAVLARQIGLNLEAPPGTQGTKSCEDDANHTNHTWNFINKNSRPLETDPTQSLGAETYREIAQGATHETYSAVVALRHTTLHASKSKTWTP